MKNVSQVNQIPFFFLNVASAPTHYNTIKESSFSKPNLVYQTQVFLVSHFQTKLCLTFKSLKGRNPLQALQALRTLERSARFLRHILEKGYCIYMLEDLQLYKATCCGVFTRFPLASL